MKGLVAAFLRREAILTNHFWTQLLDVLLAFGVNWKESLAVN